MATEARLMRSAFLPALELIFRVNNDCVLVTADDGAPELDVFFQDSTLKHRFVQVGIAEQQMIGMAAGLAREGYRPYCYAILPFLSARVFEFVKLNVAAMNLPVTLFGVGTGYSYAHMGPSHHCVEDISLMRTCPGIEIWSPSDPASAAMMAWASYDTQTPKYIRLDRTPLLDLAGRVDGIGDGWRTLCVGDDVTIIATGIMTHRALEVAEELWAMERLACSVVDVFVLNPLAGSLIRSRLANKPVVVLEEHFTSGGLGSIVAEALVDSGRKPNLLRIGVPNRYAFIYSGRNDIHEAFGLDKKSVVGKIRKWLGRNI